MRGLFGRDRRGAATAAVLAVLALGPSACSDEEEEKADTGSGAAAAQSDTPKVRTTRVEVVEGLGAKGRLDASSLYDRLSPGVVTILSVFDGGASLLSEDGGEGGQGSGFVLDEEGYIATNAHVVTTGDAPATERAKEVFVEFSDGNRVPAEIIGDDPNSDVALIKVDPAGLDLTPLELGRSDDLIVGQPVAAIGSPFGERQSLSVGVVSALDRNIESLTAFAIGNAIQTDDPAGALVVEVAPGSPADDVGLEAGGRKIEFQGQTDIPSGGDVIVGVEGRKLSLRDDLADLISAKSTGDEVELDVVRGDERRTVKVELGERPDRAPEQP